MKNIRQMIALAAAAALCTGCGTAQSSVPEPEPAALPVIWDSANPDTAEKLTYTENGEAQTVYETEDSAVIAECITALKAMTVGAETDTRYADAGAVLVFAFADGGTARVQFEHGNFISGKQAYETAGYSEVEAVLQKMRDDAE